MGISTTTPLVPLKKLVGGGNTVPETKGTNLAAPRNIGRWPWCHLTTTGSDRAVGLKRQEHIARDDNDGTPAAC